MKKPPGIKKGVYFADTGISAFLIESHMFHTFEVLRPQTPRLQTPGAPVQHPPSLPGAESAKTDLLRGPLVSQTPVSIG